MGQSSSNPFQGPMQRILPKLKESEQQQTISTCADICKFLATTKNFVSNALSRVAISQLLDDLCEAIDVQLLTQLCNDVVSLQTRSYELQHMIVERCRENKESYEKSFGLNMLTFSMLAAQQNPACVLQYNKMMLDAVDAEKTTAACTQVTKNLKEIKDGLVNLARSQSELKGKRNGLSHVRSDSDARERKIVQDMKAEFTHILRRTQDEVNSSIDIINKF